VGSPRKANTRAITVADAAALGRQVKRDDRDVPLVRPPDNGRRIDVALDASTYPISKLLVALPAVRTF
jgi:hypothetical protein